MKNFRHIFLNHTSIHCRVLQPRTRVFGQVGTTAERKVVMSGRKGTIKTVLPYIFWAIFVLDI